METSVKPTSTLVFDKDLDLKVDVYLPPSIVDGQPESGEEVLKRQDELKKLPAVVYFHHGGMVSGDRAGIFPPDLPERLTSKGIILFSPDYRLLHPSNASDLLTDVHNFFSYLSPYSKPKALISLLSASGFALDPSRLVVLGASGGNYAARGAAVMPTVSPRPIGWVSAFGQGNDWLIDEWLKPKDIQTAFPPSHFAYDDAKAEELLKLDEKDFSVADKFTLIDGKFATEKGRSNLQRIWQRDGVYLDHLLRAPGLSESLASIPYPSRLSRLGFLDARYPHLLLPLSPSVPANVYILHGADDKIISVQESKSLEKALGQLGEFKGKKREVAVDYVEGAGHGLSAEGKKLGEYAEGYDAAMDKLTEWIVKVLA
ncbi:hypothetical protein I350_07516 [Cryptococcus amylolentus CBS 6273]|uniref:Alpha/beta hydrolase fold-3 domain-containing protein n=1 Tax=Cryptococcus amylolentus CBS 6273 TaxID=1296118 RepID=A0A1E3JDA1_9TREE|nr:hypothetical protein I350_07516 [Cryptococcus amylolentus CBS 6273]